MKVSQSQHIGLIHSLAGEVDREHATCCWFLCVYVFVVVHEMAGFLFNCERVLALHRIICRHTLAIGHNYCTLSHMHLSKFCHDAE